MDARGRLVVAVMLAAGMVVLAQPPLAQDPRYHEMADQRALLGIPNALNVVSNVPFAIVGGIGLAGSFRQRRHQPWVRWPYAAVFGGTLLTALGSSYYHLAPDNARLVWDRLPMTLAFMGLLAAVVWERASPALSRVLFGPLLALGAGSVAYWYGSELRGAGDLRPYALVQFGSLLAIVLILLLYRRPGRGTGWLIAGLVAYGVAKLFELLDQPILAAVEIVSGHTLKHLAAAAGLACVAVQQRRLVGGCSPPCKSLGAGSFCCTSPGTPRPSRFSVDRGAGSRVTFRRSVPQRM